MRCPQKIALGLLILSGAPTFAQDAWKPRCSVADTLPPAPAPRQLSTEACHIFASVALIESALYRQYGRHILLSETDLFLKSKIESANFVQGLLLKRALGRRLTMDDFKQREVGTPREDLNFAFQYGVAERHEAPGIAPFAIESALTRYEVWRLRVIEKQSPQIGKEDEKEILADGDNALMKTLAVEREAVRQKLQAGFKISSFSKIPDIDMAMVKEEILSHIPFVKQRQRMKGWILDQLDHGRPVIVYVPGHVFIIEGYKLGRDGEPSFQLRDSLDDQRYSDSEALSNALELITLTAPDDRPGYCR